jgi:hypothetical protein
MGTIRRLALALLIVFGSIASGNAADQTLLYYFSEPGDYIGQGEEITITPTDGSFQANSNYASGVQIYFNNFSNPNPQNYIWWDANFAAPNGVPLQVGTYEEAERWPFQSPGHPGLDFSGSGRGCNTLTGRFVILELELGPSNEVLRFAADLEQHCEGGQPALFAQIRFNSSVPLSGKPVSITLENGLNAQRCVEATSPEGAQINVNAYDVRDSQGGTNLTYQWSTTAGVAGTGPAFSFQAPLATPSTVQLTVFDGPTAKSKTVTKAVCVSDTTPPRITIRSPQQGSVIRSGKFLLDLMIEDTVDRKIGSYEVFEGTEAVIGLDPRLNGRSVLKFPSSRSAVGPVTSRITIRAQDSSGNVGEASVDVTYPNRGQ